MSGGRGSALVRVAGLACGCVLGIGLAAPQEAPSPLVIQVRPGDIPGIGEAAPVILDMSGVLQRASRDNLDLRISSSLSDAAEGERRSASARWWPSLGAGALRRHTDGTLQGTFGEIGTSMFGTALANAIVRWDLNPGQTHFESRAAGNVADAAQAVVDAARLRAQMTAVTRYLELLGAAALTTVAQQTRDDSEEFLRMSRTLEEKGLGPGADVQRARAQAARRAEDLAMAQQAFRIASVRLAETLDLDPAARIQPGDDTIAEPALPETGDIEVLVTTALDGRPETRVTAAEVAAAQARLQALRWEAYGPEISLEAQQGVIGTDFPDAGKRSIYGAAVGWTFRPHEAGAIQAAHARLAAARLGEKRTQQTIRAEVVTAREGVELARRRLDLSREALDAAAHALRISQARFSGGLGNSLEVLLAQDVLAAARADAVATLVDAHRAVYELRRALGQPLDSLSTLPKFVSCPSEESVE